MHRPKLVAILRRLRKRLDPTCADRYREVIHACVYKKARRIVRQQRDRAIFEHQRATVLGPTGNSEKRWDDILLTLEVPGMP
jgi:hypothetical protein